MRYNLLVWCIHSCRRDVFLQELDKGLLPNFQGLIDRGLFLPSAIVGGHFQRVSHHSEITGRPCVSPVSPAENIYNAARVSGAFVGTVRDWAIANWTERFAEDGTVSSTRDIIPNLVDRPGIPNIEAPNVQFRPDVGPERWLYWYRARSTHRPFSNVVLAFERDGGFLEEVTTRDADSVIDQQRMALRIQDRWFGETLSHIEEQGRLDDTLVVIFSSHGSSLGGWLPLMGRVTKATVDHTAQNFHPNVSRSFAAMAGPGILPGRKETWVSTMDLKPTLCAHLEIPDLGGSIYGVDLRADGLPSDRILADVSTADIYSLFGTASGWLYMALPPRRPDWLEGLPPAEQGFLAFNLDDDPACARPRNEEFDDSGLRDRFAAEAARLGLTFR